MLQNEIPKSCMKPFLLFFAVFCSAISCFNASAATTHYVDMNCTNPTAPYTNWVTAATNIQSAIDNGATQNGDLILVTNGIDQTGGRYYADSTSNRVVIYKSITVQSLNGPAVTTICGYQEGATNTPRAI